MKRKKSAVSSGKTSQPLKPCQLMCATCGGLYKILSLALSSVQLAISLYFGLFLYTNVHFIDRDTRSLLATHNQTLHILFVDYDLFSFHSSVSFPFFVYLGLSFCCCWSNACYTKGSLSAFGQFKRIVLKSVFLRCFFFVFVCPLCRSISSHVRISVCSRL